MESLANDTAVLPAVFVFNKESCLVMAKLSSLFKKYESEYVFVFVKWLIKSEMNVITLNLNNYHKFSD